jgi:[acyl-carrier-protein] S-malonyltransferase
MGKALAGASRAARDVFDEVDETLGLNLFRLMRDGPDDELKLTENAQPAIMAHSIAVLRTMGVQLAEVADFVAGHSLGEYSALCAAGSLDLATTAKLLKLRGQAMQHAVPVGQGAMAALLGADLALAQKIAQAAAQAEVCTVANDNDPSQDVISGHKGAIERLKTLLDVTQGNLSVHLRKLEEANYVSIDKSFLDRKPLTRVRMTDAGRAAFAAYLEAIARLVGDGR